MLSDTSSAVTLYGGRDRDWTEDVLAACPQIREGCQAPVWARNGHTQATLSVYHDDRAPSFAFDLEERLTMADGGTVSLQWTALDAPADTPVLVVLHTICGSGRSLRRFIASMRRRLGWVVVVCNRRGHADLPLTAPRINTMGFVEDLDEQLDAIAARRPGAALYAAGISAGSALLVRYLGEYAEASRFVAGVSVCPAYDIPDGLRYAHPRYDAHMTRKMIRFFLHRNREVFASIAGFEHCMQARTMVEFHARLFPLAGFESLAAYETASDPMRVAERIRTPVLVLNAEDDPPRVIDDGPRAPTQLRCAVATGLPARR